MGGRFSKRAGRGATFTPYFNWKGTGKMYHKISEMCDVVSVMYDKSMNLRRLKYDTPKEQQDKVMIDALVEDIQALAQQIAFDRQPYVKNPK